MIGMQLCAIKTVTVMERLMDKNWEILSVSGHQLALSHPAQLQGILVRDVYQFIIQK